MRQRCVIENPPKEDRLDHSVPDEIHVEDDQNEDALAYFEEFTV